MLPSTPLTSDAIRPWWPLPPSRLTLKGAALLALLVMASLTLEAWLYFDVVKPWLQGVTDAAGFAHEVSPLSPGWQRFESVVFAPVVEESAFRLAFSASLPALVAATIAGDRANALKGILATLLLACAFYGNVLFGLGHLSEGLSLAGVCYLVSLLATVPLVVRIFKGLTIPRQLWLTIAIVTTLAFAISHLDNYTQLPHHPAVTLLTIPQLFGGSIFCYAAWRYGLRASILTHMASNGLLALPWFAGWLHWIAAGI